MIQLTYGDGRGEGIMGYGGTRRRASGFDGLL